MTRPSCKNCPVVNHVLAVGVTPINLNNSTNSSDISKIVRKTNVMQSHSLVEDVVIELEDGRSTATVINNIEDLCSSLNIEEQGNSSQELIEIIQPVVPCEITYNANLISEQSGYKNIDSNLEIEYHHEDETNSSVSLYHPSDISENSDSDKENTEQNQSIPPSSSESKRTKKRKRRAEIWNKNVNKKKRLDEQEYIGHKDKIKNKRSMGPSCNYRMNCSKLVSDNERASIFETFWKKIRTWDQRRQFLAQCVTRKL